MPSRSGAILGRADSLVKVFHCDNCRHLVFFENTRCVRCESTLAYLPHRESNAYALAGPPIEKLRLVHETIASVARTGGPGVPNPK
jgi:hypothetical protein